MGQWYYKGLKWGSTDYWDNGTLRHLSGEALTTGTKVPSGTKVGNHLLLGQWYHQGLKWGSTDYWDNGTTRD